MQPGDVFSFIFEGNKWHGKQSVSGRGSDLDQTGTVIKVIPELCRELGVRRLLDVPCGDFNWMAQADLEGVAYTGGDIVAGLIASNQATSREGISFQVIDIAKDPLPEADLLLTRDCFVHLSFDLIRAAIDNIRGSGVTYFLTTTFPDEAENRDIVTGDWRRLNLNLPPFNFPPPERLIREEYFEEGHHCGSKSLGLWRVSDLPAPV